MDPFSHALYGGLISRNRQTFILGFIFGALPDLVLVTLSPRQAFEIFVTSSAQLPHYYIILYRYLHSLLTAGLIYLFLSLFFPRYRVFALPYLFHIIVDIFTHCGQYATRFFYPLSQISICGYSYEGRYWLWFVNYLIIFGCYYYKYQHAPSKNLPSSRSSRS